MGEKIRKDVQKDISSTGRLARFLKILAIFIWAASFIAAIVFSLSSGPTASYFYEHRTEEILFRFASFFGILLGTVVIGVVVYRIGGYFDEMRRISQEAKALKSFDDEEQEN